MEIENFSIPDQGNGLDLFLSVKEDDGVFYLELIPKDYKGGGLVFFSKDQAVAMANYIKASVEKLGAL